MCRESGLCLAAVCAMCRVSEAQGRGCTVDGVQACGSECNVSIWEGLQSEAGNADAFGSEGFEDAGRSSPVERVQAATEAGACQEPPRLMFFASYVVYLQYVHGSV